MINKTFKGGRTYDGAKTTIEYLLNERVEEGSSRLLIGDSELTLSFIKYASRKNKWSWSSGVLTFLETFDDKTKLEIIDIWRETFFCGLDSSQYNDLWINHQDKNRTELHYIVPRLELSTGLSFNPYFVTRDFHKKDLFQEYINLKYGFSSFKDAKEITSRYDNKNWNSDVSKLKKEIDKEVLNLIKKGSINNRDEMIEYMREVGFEIKYLGKESLSFTHSEVINNKGENFSITMKGKQYGESYRDWESLEAEVIAESQTVGRGVPRDIGKIREELDKIIKQQAYTNRKQYEPKRRKNLTANREKSSDKSRGEIRQYRESNDEETLDNGSKRERILSIKQTQARSDIGEIGSNPHIQKDRRREDSDKRENIQGQDTKRETTRRKLRDDTIRTETLRGARERESIQSAITKSTHSRNKYADERASKRLYINNTAFDKRAKRRIIQDQRREARREIRYAITVKKIEFRDEHHYQSIARELNRQQNRRVIKRVIYRLKNSIKPIIKRCERGFNLRNQAVKQELNRGHQSILESIENRVKRELESFKSSINLVSFASLFGYEKDMLNTSLSMAVLRNEQREEEIIVWKDIQSNHYRFLNSTDTNDTGTIIDFIKTRTDKSSRELRKICKEWIKSPKSPQEISLKAISEEILKLSYDWQILDKRISSYTHSKIKSQ